MGRFTLRDEGKTICIGKVLKYKPYNTVAAGADIVKDSAEVVSRTASQFPVTINSSNVKEEVFDMETGESRPAAAKLNGIAEGDEDEDEDAFVAGL
jgi:hypothetical protein